MQVESEKVAEYSFRMLSITGVWRPISFTSVWQIRLYNIYSAIVFIFNNFFVSTFLINLYQNRSNPEVYIENFFFFTTTILICVKVTYFNIYRDDITSLINMFVQKNCLSRNNKEAAIHHKYNEKKRFVKLINYFSAIIRI